MQPIIIAIKKVKVGSVVMHQVKVNGTVMDLFENRVDAENCKAKCLANWVNSAKKVA